MATSAVSLSQVSAGSRSGATGRSQSGDEQAAKRKILTKAEIDSALRELNTAMRSLGTSLSFSVDGVTKQTVVTVTDAQTHEVIRQIPSEDMLRVSQRITELLGVLFDRAA
ncbi:MAG: flagellar protein FlaG [Ignavibacteriales bacterium]|nr:flagellar protein FlaG [Ignavibacteriales bacterium]